MTVETSYGQLITDSDKRLKTQKKDAQAEARDKKKKRGGRSPSASGAFNQDYKGGTPRYSPGSPFLSFRKRKLESPRTTRYSRAKLWNDNRYKSPRYSSTGIAGIFSGKQKTIRYSPGSPFTAKDRVVSPRYSPGSPFRQNNQGFISRLFNPAQGPRYSPGSPFTAKDKAVSPRYSPGSPYRQNQSGFLSRLLSPASGPRYSPGSPFTAKDKQVSPRYSVGSPFDQDRPNLISRLFSPSTGPRYSTGSPFTEKDRQVSPRYSVGDPFKNDKSLLQLLFSSDPTPRYSMGMPYEKKDYYVNPRYSTMKNRFVVDKKAKRENRVFELEAPYYKGQSKKKLRWLANFEDLTDSYQSAKYDGAFNVPRYQPSIGPGTNSIPGDFKVKWIKQKNMHPSSAHMKANQDSELLRNSLRKWNILLTRLSRNKQQPKAVTEKVSKPKFDRKEAEIWND